MMSIIQSGESDIDIDEAQSEGNGKTDQENLTESLQHLLSEFPHRDIERAIANLWDEEGNLEVDLLSDKPPYYNLMMFPYPSAEGLHIGNFYAFTGADIFGRFKRLNGFNVFEPMGWDAFGIHSENFAMKTNRHPVSLTRENVKTFKRQLSSFGALYDWRYEINTTSPEYYRWNQWLFLELLKSGLAYRKSSLVNRCPECQTVISDEQVVNGRCERHGDTPVERKELTQWFLKITDFADELYERLESLDRSEITKSTQREWIGKTTGTVISFELEGIDDNIDVFTTRVDTLFGVTFIALSPSSELAKKIVNESDKEKLEQLLQEQSFDKNPEKDGLFTGKYCIHPLTGAKIPVYIANYVLGDYGTGGVMGVPGHDQRDLEFAEKFNIPIVDVYDEKGILKNSGEFDGVEKDVALQKIKHRLEESGSGHEEVKFRLRDWCISRQRYWGTPIPVVHCDDCGIVPVDPNELPVTLPYVENFKPKGDGVSPLSNIEEFADVECPCCKGPAKRETDVMDNFFDSSWYFFRFLDPDNTQEIFDPEMIKKWMPVDTYIGGNEHAVLHLMYTRFMTKVLKKIGLIDFDEPFKRFIAHGLIIKDGAKMSKSKGNVINPDEYIDEYGADVLRTYLMFMGPLSKGGDFRESGIKGIYKFFTKLFRFFATKTINFDGEVSDPKFLNDTIKSVTNAYENFKYNVVISKIMELYNSLSKLEEISDHEVRVLLTLLAPIAPFFTDYIWRERLKENDSIHNGSWPVADETIETEQIIEFPVQIDGKKRGALHIPQDLSKDEILALIEKEPDLYKFIGDANIKKVIFVPGKIINIVLS